MSSLVCHGYEIMLITRAQLTDVAFKALQEKLSRVVEDFHGEVVLTEDWGKRRLAYPIQKEERGHYTYLVYTGDSGVVREMERYLRLQDSVLRFLTVSLGAEFNPSDFRKQRLDLSLAAKRREEEREARREEKYHERGGYRPHGEERRSHDVDFVEDLGEIEEE